MDLIKKPRMKKIVKMAVLQKQLSDHNISLNTIPEIIVFEPTLEPVGPVEPVGRLLQEDDPVMDPALSGLTVPVGRLFYASAKLEQLQMKKLKRIEFMTMKSQGLLKTNSFVSDTL